MGQESNMQNLGDIPICIAIDKSGSTYGQTLRQEISVVRNICSLVSPRNESPVQLLPWCDRVQAPIKLPKESTMMDSLTSDGGTNPSIIYSTPQSIQVLRNCGLWFLLTDGQIKENLIQEFAVSTAELGLHGTACIVVVFGSTMDGPPATCDVSVGLAAYAVAPDCMFLFQDTTTGRVFILQAKGCFKTLLVSNGSIPIQPVLNKYTTWAELPTLHYSDLAQIKIAPPRKVAPDEMALQDGLVVRVQDLYSGNADDHTVEEIVKNEDNLKSLVIAEMARGTGRDLQKWLNSQQKPAPELTRHRPDRNGRAQKLVMQVLTAMQMNQSEKFLKPTRLSLREAHRENLKDFGDITGAHLREESFFRHKCSNVMAAQRQIVPQQLFEPERPSLMVSTNSSDTIGFDYGDVHIPSRTIDSQSSPTLWDQGSNSKETKSIELEFTFLPGFRRSPDKSHSEFKGSCMLCEEQAVLTILTKSPPDISTSNFPSRGAAAPLAFPLAMSSFAETDIISFFICCDSCSLYLVRNCTSPLKEVVTGALPLTGVQENLQAWLDVIDVALKGRFQRSDLATLLVAILDKKILENRSLPPRAKPNDGTLYEDALLWAKMELSRFSEVPFNLSTSFKSRHPAHPGIGNRRTSYLWTIISEQAVINPCDASNVDIAMLRYPVPGFMVLIRLMQDKRAPEEQLKAYMFQRLIYFLTENYFAPPQNGTPSPRKLLQDLLSTPAVETSAETSVRPPSTGFQVKISIDMLLRHNLLDTTTLTSFRTMDGFKHVEEGTEPATAVYLHALSLKGPLYRSAMDYFNALKVHSNLGKIIMKPLAISEGLAADLIVQI